MRTDPRASRAAASIAVSKSLGRDHPADEKHPDGVMVSPGQTVELLPPFACG
jgi:hypothetical protein